MQERKSDEKATRLLVNLEADFVRTYFSDREPMDVLCIDIERPARETVMSWPALLEYLNTIPIAGAGFVVMNGPEGISVNYITIYLASSWKKKELQNLPTCRSNDPIDAGWTESSGCKNMAWSPYSLTQVVQGWKMKSSNASYDHLISKMQEGHQRRER